MDNHHGLARREPATLEKHDVGAIVPRGADLAVRDGAMPAVPTPTAVAQIVDAVRHAPIVEPVVHLVATWVRTNFWRPLEYSTRTTARVEREPARPLRDGGEEGSISASSRPTLPMNAHRALPPPGRRALPPGK